MTSLDGIDILQTSTDLLQYPGNATMVGILGNGTQRTGNAVMQSSALGWKTANISFRLDTFSDMVAIRSLTETHDEVLYVDHLAATHSVRVLNLTSRMDGNGLWDCVATIVETEAFMTYS